ncbi:hypothetical protein ACFODZ_16590 [Marinicella sediminis]|uniref:Uncharacterized protein n=1 Tax=Marinicella sediminis TaxID=1792834 RepID=A0ABV7JCM2_9GAMM|nr:hypothetical protein [Marinicella sediminis]
MVELLSQNDMAYLAVAVEVHRSVTKRIDSSEGRQDLSLDEALMIAGLHERAPTATHYVFEVKEVLQGNVRDSVIVSIEERELSFPCSRDNDFDGHAESDFWIESEGRAIMQGHHESHGITTCFELGKSYLLLNERLFGTQSYELIESTDDLWYQLIKQQSSHD